MKAIPHPGPYEQEFKLCKTASTKAQPMIAQILLNLMRSMTGSQICKNKIRTEESNEHFHAMQHQYNPNGLNYKRATCLILNNDTNCNRTEKLRPEPIFKSRFNTGAH